MKIQIHNFGPIHRFECDLGKELHLIVGENNVGKSYGITVVYLLLKAMMKSGKALEMAEFLHERAQRLPEDAFDKVSALNAGDEADIGELFRAEVIGILRDTFLNRFRDYVGETYGPMDYVINKFSGEEPRITLLFDSARLDIGVAGNAFELKELMIERSIRSGCAEEDLPPSYSGNDIVIYHNSRDPGHFRAGFTVACAHFCGEMLKGALSGVRHVHYLPASRTAAYQALFAIKGIIAGSSGSEALPDAAPLRLPRREKQGDGSLPDDRLFKKLTSLDSSINIRETSTKLPKNLTDFYSIPTSLNDYFRELSEMGPTGSGHENDPINTIAEDIQRNILRGDVEFDGTTKKMSYMPHGMGLRLDIGATSSMVSELSPLIFFLRHIAARDRTGARTSPSGIREENTAPKTLIFIEEPEAHLHPKNQVRLMEAFAALIRAGVKIFLTSHSNYIFTKLNNLILAREIDVDVVGAWVFKPSGMGSEAIPLEVDRLGIDDENFIDVAEELYEEKIELLERLNADVR
ncbi:MAG: AAA ATPase domain-containing protein [Candidatus Kentron sp. G]|nr:MAG: AAA ATPase domain-containing protein [Candidatus Kentron sp. G]VFM99923.1 MAG: AAA ATPase domain-containing protein [Candidatus Kentron sp. G]